MSGKITLKYKNTGTYEVVLVATTVGGLGENILVATKELTIQVLNSSNE